MTRKNCYLARGVIVAAGMAACLVGAVFADSQEPGSKAIRPMRVAVCGLIGEGLPRSALSWLSELVQLEVSKADSVQVTEDLLDCSSEWKEVAATTRDAGADKVIMGEVTTVADLFVVELRLVDVQSGAVEANQTVEVVGSPLDPRTAVRVAAQRLLGIGGEGVLPESYLDVSSTPPGAKVFVGGLLEGRAPITLRVVPGRHSIKAVLPGYAPWALDVDVKNGEALSLNAALDRALTATQSKSDGGRVILGFVVPYAAVLGEAAMYVAEVRSGKPYLGWALVAPPVAYLVGSDVLGNSEIEVGRAVAIVSSGLWGAAWGILGAGTSGLDSPRPYVVVSMTSSMTGLLLTTSITENQKINRKRISLINSGGFMGSLVGLGIPYLLDVSRPRVYNMSLLAGGILGVVTMASLTSDLDFVEGGSQRSSLLLSPEIWCDGGVGSPGRFEESSLGASSPRWGMLVRIRLN